VDVEEVPSWAARRVAGALRATWTTNPLRDAEHYGQSLDLVSLCEGKLFHMRVNVAPCRQKFVAEESW